MYLFTACHDIEMVNNHVDATTARGEGMDINIDNTSYLKIDLPLPVLIGVEDLEIKQQPFISRTTSSPHAADDDPWKTLVSVEVHSNNVYSKPSKPVMKPDEPKETIKSQPETITRRTETAVVKAKPDPPAPVIIPAPAPITHEPATETLPVKERASSPTNNPATSPRTLSSSSYHQAASPSTLGTSSTHGSAVAPRAVTPEQPRVRGSTDNYQWFLDMDLVKVNVAPEREGFLFKHTNYVVESQQRSSVVLRRYSDFWWLLETLMKRYPFRILPNLPPKKLGGMDNAFLDKRRKGLARFVNFLVCHPVLGQDQVVEKFLSEPSELLAWRRQHPPSIDEEFVRLDPDVKEIQAGIPADLEERLAKVGSNMATSIEHYKNMCFAVERMIKRTEAQANDYSRYSSALR